MKLDVRAFGLACGIIWSACALMLGILSMAIHWGDGMVKILSSMYIGYNSTISGSLIGAVWGFFDAGIGGVTIAWLYNRLSK